MDQQHWGCSAADYVPDLCFWSKASVLEPRYTVISVTLVEPEVPASVCWSHEHIVHCIANTMISFVLSTWFHCSLEWSLQHEFITYSVWVACIAFCTWHVTVFTAAEHAGREAHHSWCFSLTTVLEILWLPTLAGLPSSYCAAWFLLWAARVL